jgi:hypothetical protein
MLRLTGTRSKKRTPKARRTEGNSRSRRRRKRRSRRRRSRS